MEFRSRGNLDASQENKRQYAATHANCIIVSVAGLSKAVRIDLDEVFVRAEDQYHATHSPYKGKYQYICYQRGNGAMRHTISFHDTGARRATATSCAFWLTLAERM